MPKRAALSALTYYSAFNRLIEKREEIGMTVQRMSELLKDISTHTDEFLPLTEEEIRGIEDDPTHGFDPKAMTYLRFMGANLKVVSTRYNLPIRTEFAFKGRGTTTGLSRCYDMLASLPGEADVTGLYVNIERNGKKEQIYVRLSQHDALFDRIREVLMEHVEERMHERDAATKAMFERYTALWGRTE